ncbi:MAG: glycerol-3-phosphate 1-O-acyltransferase PlsY [Hornefia sp.]|nr:glycerol-3-phosphate 1-O-acyltransferase PlsY [Hornefia sp.]
MIEYKFIIFVAVAYFLGNISPSTIQAKKRGVDIKSEGSGNAGTTNTFRVLGAKPAIITLVVDILKGVVAVLLGLYFSGKAAMFCALFVFLGHVYPIIYKFKGGKGIATAFGATMAIDWRIGLILLSIVAVMFIFTKTVSISALVAVVAYPLICYMIKPEFVYISFAMALIALFKHRGNIHRILKGEEKKVCEFSSERKVK